MTMDDRVGGLPNFSGKVAVVTGAAAGFGEAFSRAFAKAGAAVALLDIDERLAAEVAASIVAEGGKAQAFKCDVADEDAVEKVVAATAERFGGVDFLINNAGLHLTKYSQRFDQLTRAEIRRLFDVNIMGIINCTLACKPFMTGRMGAIVNIASITAYLWTSPYAISKLAVRGLTTAFSQELSVDAIRVNAIAPGLMATPNAMNDLPPDMIKNFVERLQHVKRRGEISDITAMVMFLCSPDASFITGETIKVSGGFPMNS